MKKFVFILMLGFLVVGLVGCNNNDSDDAGDETGINLTSDTSEENDSNNASASENLLLGDFTVLEGMHGFPGDRTGILTIDEAALIGGNYILEALGHNLEGMYMELTFNYNPHISHSTWIGNIDYSLENFGSEAEGFASRLIVFSIDAFTGARISIVDNRVEPLYNIPDLWWELSENELRELFPKPSSEEMEIMMTTAHNYARSHFAHELEINVEFGFYMDGFIDTSDQFSPNWSLVATDSDGRVAQIVIQCETRQLISIDTPLEVLMSTD